MVKSGTGLGHRIRQARLRQWKSQAELAEAAGTNQQEISKLENDHFTPTTAVLVRIATELAIPETELFALSGRLRPNAIIYMKKHPLLWELIHAIARRRLNDVELARVGALVGTLGQAARKED